jgi:hypothetical protein
MESKDQVTKVIPRLLMLYTLQAATPKLACHPALRWSAAKHLKGGSHDQADHNNK